MTHQSTKKFHLIWVLLALLGYAAQSVAYMGGMNHMQVSFKSALTEQPHVIDEIESSESMMPGCHGDHSNIKNEVQSEANSDQSETCCDGGCFMMACHNASVAALLTSFTTPLFKAYSTQNPIAPVSLGAGPIQSLYRPPIFS